MLGYKENAKQPGSEGETKETSSFKGGSCREVMYLKCYDFAHINTAPVSQIECVCQNNVNNIRGKH